MAVPGRQTNTTPIIALKKLFRQTPPDPQQLALQLEFSADDVPPPSASGSPAAAPDAIGTPAPCSDAATLPPLVPGKRRIQIGEHVLDYALLRSKRRSIGFLIDDDGLRVTAPKWVSMADIETAVREKQKWIFTKITERRERSARRLQPQMQWRDGAMLPYLGGEIRLRIVSAQQDGVHFDEAARELAISLPAGAGEQQLKDRVLGWLQSEARKLFAERLPLYAEKLGVAYRSFALTSAMTQWGSCTAEGKIRLNWRLMHFALPQIDYVIAHELAHLREMNHSPRFWAAVQSVFPEFQAAKKVLREHAPETLPIF